MSKATLKPVISKLRESIIKDIAGKMEKYGFDDAGRIVTNKPLSEYDNVIKNNLVSLFKGKNIEGNKKKYIAYIQDSARTFLHILICFRTMEQRGIMGNVVGRLMNDHIYDAVIPDFINVPPMAFSDLSEKFSSVISIMEEKDNYEEDREYYNFIYMLSALTKEMAKEVPLLFKDYEHNLVHPDFEGLKEILFNINKIDENEYSEDDFLGWIYQYWVDIKDDELKTAEGEKDVSYANSIFHEILNNLEEEQTQFGEFYTPRWVVKYIVDNTLKPYYEDNKKIETIKLLDPACGAGNFLVYAFDIFYELYKAEHPDWPDNFIIGSILEKNIFGVDIQREPLQITAINLWLKAKKKAQDARIRNLNLFNMNILKANSLYRWENDQEEVFQLSLFQDEIEFTERQYTAEDIGQYISAQAFIAKKEARLFFKNKFNVIVMNPPFVDSRKMDEKTLEFLKEEYPNNSRNLFSAFIQRAIELNSKNGRIGFISSDTFLTISSFTSIRKELLQKTIENATLLGNEVFDGPTVSAVILVVKNSVDKNNQIDIFDYRSRTINEGDREASKQLRQSTLYQIKNFPFVFHVSDNFRQLFNLNSIGDYLEIFEVRKGIVTSKNERFLKYKWEVPKSRIGNEFLPYNKDIENFAYDRNYVLDWRRDTQVEILKSPSSRCAYIRDNYDPITGKYSFKSGILFSLTGELKYCKLENELFDVSFPAILIERKELTNYILALISSKLSKYILNIINSTIHTTPGDVRRLPVKFPDMELNKTIDECINRIIEIKETILSFNYTSDMYQEVELAYGFSNGGRNVKEAYSIFIEKINELQIEYFSLRNKINQLVYEIYDLSNVDISIIEREFADLDPFADDYTIEKAILNYLRSIVKKSIEDSENKLYTDKEIEVVILKKIEDLFGKEYGYRIVEDIEAVLGRKIVDLIRSGVKIGSSNYTLAGKGSKDLDEPLLQQKVLSGTGSNKQVVIWHLSHFLLEFEEDKKYVMQNEIRRLSNEVYRPWLQTVKEKLQGSVSRAEKKELEKQEKLLSEAVKTLEAWKVVN